MQGCNHVLHIASPTHAGAKMLENEMIKTAIEGTLRVLKAAKEAGVKRVVMASSFGAVGFSNLQSNTVTTETDWTDSNQKGLSAYEKIKRIGRESSLGFHPTRR